jgi:radical SAM-linked protein
VQRRSGSTGRDADDAGASKAKQPPAVVEPPRQRWRLVLARSADGPQLAGRDLTDAWESALEASGLPVHLAAGRTRGRVAFAAPLPLGVAAERELAEILLSERVPIWRVREALSARLPAGWTLVDLFDVWPAGPPVAGRVVAADYRIELAEVVDPGKLAVAARSLLESNSLPRTRQKGGAVAGYDLRPLLLDVAVDEDRGSPIRVRTRIHPELGTGRPEEVMAELGERVGRPLEVRSVVRERLILSDETG